MKSSIWDEVEAEAAAPKTQHQSIWDEIEAEAPSQPNRSAAIAKQGAVGVAKGLGGAYGSLRELTRTNPKERLLPGQKLRAEAEAKGTEKELISASTESDIMPEGTGRTPTHEDIGNFLKLLGINTQADTPAERIAQQAGESLGSSVSLGPAKVATTLATIGGATGQALREAHAPEWLAMAADVGVNLADVVKKGIGGLTKEVAKKESGLTTRQFEKLEKPTQVFESTKEKAIEAVGKEYKDIVEDLQKSTNASLKQVREDPTFQRKLSDAFQELHSSAEKVIQKASSKTYQKSLVNEYTNTGKKGFEKSEVEQKFHEELSKAIRSQQGKEYTLTELIDQYRKNNSDLKHYLPYGEKAVENVAKRDVLLAKNSAIAKTIEQDFGNIPEAKQFSDLNKQWHEVEKVKVVDKFVENVLKDGKISASALNKSLDPSSKKTRSLEQAIGKKNVEQFRKLNSDLLSQEKAIALMGAKGISLKDIPYDILAFFSGIKLLKLPIGAKIISKAWRMGLSNPDFRTKWSNANAAFKRNDIKK